MALCLGKRVMPTSLRYKKPCAGGSLHSHLGHLLFAICPNPSPLLPPWLVSSAAEATSQVILATEPTSTGPSEPPPWTASLLMPWGAWWEPPARCSACCLIIVRCWSLQFRETGSPAFLRASCGAAGNHLGLPREPGRGSTHPAVQPWVPPLAPPLCTVPREWR